VLEELAQAVEDNWAARDQWSDPRPDPPVDVEGWLLRCQPDALEWVNALGWWQNRGFLDFAFSPLSLGIGSISFVRERDDRLSVLLSVPVLVQFEHEGERELRRMKETWEEVCRQQPERSLGPRGPGRDHPDFDAWWEKWDSLEDTPKVWPRNRVLMRHIIDRLKGVFPIRQLKVAPELLPDGAADQDEGQTTQPHE
jgi:hypothetical protein